MKKYMLLVALFIGAAITASAQHTQSAADSEDKGFWNNTFVILFPSISLGTIKFSRVLPYSVRSEILT